MKRLAAFLRRVLPWLAGALLLLLLAAYLLRQPLTGAAISTGLKLAGAGGVKFDVTDASPWRVVIENVGFNFKTQQFAAKRVTFGRVHWWQPSFGAVSVEGALVPLTLDGSDVNPWAWSSYAGTGKTADVTKPMAVPVEELSVDGQLMVKVAAVSEQPLTLKFEAKQEKRNLWAGSAQLTGDGLAFSGEGSYNFDEKKLAFQVTAKSLDLKVWEEFIQSFVLIPNGPWEISGMLKGTGEGTYQAKKMTATARVEIRDGQLKNKARALAAEGIEADLTFTDLKNFTTAPGTLRVRQLTIGAVVLENLDAGLTLQSTERVDVDRVSVQLLGGSLSAEPFRLYPSQREIEATVVADGLDVEKIMALSKDVPAEATGRVDGRMPLRLDENGVRFGTGWLQLKPGVHAEVQLKAAGLLTSGVSQKSPSYAVLKKVETGLLRLRVGEMRLDIRPPDAPPGRTAQLHLSGEPVDPDVKAPVTLDLNVNG
ncbi:MAG TPA: YdbH domain-containing protein, partial [Candidatus Didemnitutus sp.]|nr:YdbH domain-containing protein [Candidatus Didemnitutus sp.]